MRWLLAAALVLVLGGVARAYPQFQVSTGAARCNQCHIAPTGGLLLSGYGRDEAGDTISRGGDGAFLHGLWDPPEWLQLGGDLRIAGLVNDNGATYSPSLAFFPMQGDLYVGVKVSDFQLLLAAGPRGTVRGQQTKTGALERFWSREHFVMWRPKQQGPYVRAGRFLLPYGLRLVEHPAYVRKFGGQNLNEEPYALSGGVVTNEHEWHLTLHTRNPLRCTGLGCADFGAAGFVEWRQGEDLVLGVDARLAFYPDAMGYHTQHVGSHAKYWLEGAKLLFMAQLDAGLKLMPEANYVNRELIGYLGASWWPTRGLMLTLSGETYAEDLAAWGTNRAAGSLELQVFPWAHVELVLYGRLTETSRLLMTQLHYYL
jgi:hypothetical protein